MARPLKDTRVWLDAEKAFAHYMNMTLGTSPMISSSPVWVTVILNAFWMIIYLTIDRCPVASFRGQP